MTPSCVSGVLSFGNLGSRKKLIYFFFNTVEDRYKEIKTMKYFEATQFMTSKKRKDP